MPAASHEADVTPICQVTSMQVCLTLVCEPFWQRMFMTWASTGHVMLPGARGSQEAAGGPHESRDGEPEGPRPAVSLL